MSLVSVAGKTLKDFPDILRTLCRIDLDDGERIAAGSNKDYTWKCDLCHDMYTRSVVKRTRRGDKCPKTICKLKKTYGNDWIPKPKSAPRIPIVRTVAPPTESEVEEWKEPNPDLLMQGYMVSSLGRIKSKNSDKILKTDSSRIYKLRTYCCSDGKTRCYTDHFVVAKSFIENDDPENKVTVNHINPNQRHDNRVINLEWATQASQNYKENRTPIKDSSRGGPVEQINLKTGQVIRTYVSVTLAAIAVGRSIATLSKACTQKTKSSAGFGWRYQPHEDLADEIWVNLNAIQSENIKAIEVSNKGRLKTWKGVATYGILSPEGYYRADVQYEATSEKRTWHGVHRLVAEAFKLPRRDDQNFVNRTLFFQMSLLS